jgi:hypothetical protein
MTTPSLDLSAATVVAPLPPNAFDFLPEFHVLIQRVYTDDIDPKEIAHESNRIRLKIGKARALVSGLPEVDKTLEQQRAEIAALKDHIARQRSVLKEAARMDVVTGLDEQKTSMDVNV